MVAAVVAGTATLDDPAPDPAEASSTAATTTPAATATTAAVAISARRLREPCPEPGDELIERAETLLVVVDVHAICADERHQA